MGKTKNKKKDDLYNGIKEDLLLQLKFKGNEDKYFIDLVEDYMAFWNLKNMLQEDILKNGVNLFYQNGENQKGTRANPSVKQLLSVNQQMIRILDKLRINMPKELLEDDDDWEL